MPLPRDSSARSLSLSSEDPYCLRKRLVTQRRATMAPLQQFTLLATREADSTVDEPVMLRARKRV